MTVVTVSLARPSLPTHILPLKGAAGASWEAAFNVTPTGIKADPISQEAGELSCRLLRADTWN